MNFISISTYSNLVIFIFFSIFFFSFGQSRMFAKHHCIFQRGKPDACTASALPCTRHCARHIMYNVDQLIFEHCTAKFPDNTQCCVPVFDISHELPLCAEHTRKRVRENLYIFMNIFVQITNKSLSDFLII